MAPTTYPTVSSRTEAASEILPTKAADLLKALETDLGISDNDFGLKILDADTTTEDYLVEALEALFKKRTLECPVLKIKAAAAFLKGRDPFERKPHATVSPTSEGMALEGIIRAMRPIDALSDKELLEAFASDREHKYEQELNRRAKGQYFVILKESAGDNPNPEIDIPSTLSLLKRTRKTVVPSMLPHPNDPGKIIEVYRITQLNPEDNIVELCPFCDDVMYRGYCSRCNANFAGVGDDERAYVRLASEKETFDTKSASDRRAILVDAGKGMDELRKNWPGVSISFRERKALGDLPKLRKKRTLPSVKVEDPFNVKSK